MGNPKKSGKRVTQASAWKGKDKTKGEPLDLPSGNTALVRAVGMETFVQRGFIPNSLMPMVQEAIQKKKAPDMGKVDINTESLEEMAKLMDDVCIYCVIEPRVLPVPKDEADRDEEQLYVDEVDLSDKTFIFQFAVGGTRDLEQFRKGLAQSMADVPTESDDGDSTQRDAGD